MAAEKVTVFRNCVLLRSHALVKEDLWVRGGRIIDPEPLFFDEKRTWDEEVDCSGALLAPGLIDLQINGAFGIDFTFDLQEEEQARADLVKVGRGLLSHGVTAYCPTVITSQAATYHRVLPWLAPRRGGQDVGAEILGAHVEGPFISRQKRGAHEERLIRDLAGDFNILRNTYGYLQHVRIVTLDPDKDLEGDVVRKCVETGLAVSVGHTMATLSTGEKAVRNGATLITHLFNAMASFHHRDPGLVGLLTSKKLEGHRVFYGIIADGIHTHMSALRMAYHANFASLCLVTDAVCALGLQDGQYRLGSQEIQVRGQRCTIAGTDTLCGAIVSLFTAVKKMLKATGCPLVQALQAASLHPAQALGIHERKGTLDCGADADFIMVGGAEDGNDITLLSTWIAGQRVYECES